MQHKRFILVSVVCASLLSSLQATQQLDEVRVTAQKSEENIQKVPISMNVLDEYTVEDRNIESLEDLSKVTSSFSFVNQGTSGVGSPTFRGLHGDFHNFNTPAVILVDGVPSLNGLGYNTTIFDIERVEVLKGPQGTLYGKNSESGVINIISKKPSNELMGKVLLGLGEDNKREASTYVSGPVVKDKLFAGISLKTSKKDGFMKNTNTGKTVGEREDFYAKLNLRATPTDNLELSLISSLVKYNDGDVHIGLKSAGKREVASDIEGYNKSKTTMNSFKLSYDYNDYLFESITAYKQYKDDALQDWDFTSANGYHERRPSKNEYSTLSQELRLSSSYKATKWLTGLYADKDKVNFYSEQVGTSNVIHDPINSKSVGLFTHVTHDFNSKLSLLTGLRYDKERKKHEGYNNEKTFNALSPKVAFNYHVNENSMAYANVAKGYRAGGFNTSATVANNKAAQSFEQEELMSYELGMKNELFNRRLLLNIALYYMDIKDMQVKTALSPFSGYTSNAGRSRSQGLELESSFKLNESINFFANLGLNKTTFKDFQDNTFDSNGNKTGTTNYKGNDNIYSPRYNYNLGVSYRDTKGYFARADLSGFGSMYTDKQNTNKVDAYRLVDVKVGFEQGSYEVYLYSKNLFDKEHNIEGYNSTYTIYSKPRESGVQFVYRF